MNLLPIETRPNEMSETFPVGAWLWSDDHGQPCKVLEHAPLWDHVSYVVWLPHSETVIRVTSDKLKALNFSDTGSLFRVRYVLFAARIANLLNEAKLLAPGSTAVIPLPHQLKALRRAVLQDRIRFLLADEVGLGKTIEAGLIMRELKLRGLVKRTLVVAPKGLVTQWLAEMQTHFGEEFRFFSPPDFPSYRRIAPIENVWRSFDQVICSLDSVKPLEARQGWSNEDLEAFNRERFEDLITAGWDLIIVDESHRLGGSTEQVARYQLGRGLAQASPYLLMLSATPHQGKSDAFHRLMSLLDKNAFPHVGSISRESVRPYVIRTEKRQAIDSEGNELFKPRITKLVGVTWTGHEDQKQLYDAVTDYVREGYNQAMIEKKSHLAFLMILMQRLVTSSTAAIVSSLEKRLEVLTEPGEQFSLLPSVSDEEWSDLDGQEQLETFLRTRLAALKNERAEVDFLLTVARKVQARGPDAKAETLLEWVYHFQREEGDPDIKVLIFTEFVPTQTMLADFLSNRGMLVVCLNGSMTMTQRQEAQVRFAKDCRILISTDAGGEGLNLQFCHIVVNYDIPWNPMRLEQRIGRVDRIGQNSVVRAINLLFEDSVEFRVREVLEQKLSVILEEFGSDKMSDVLDSAEASHLFDGLYVQALLHPDRIPESVEEVTETIRSRADEAHAKNKILSDDVVLSLNDANFDSNDRLNEWVECMTRNYLEAFGGKYEPCLNYIKIQWPDDAHERIFVARGQPHNPPPNSEILRLDHPRVSDILSQLPRFVPGMPVGKIYLRSLPPNIEGLWSLWQVKVLTPKQVKQQVLPMFVHEDGRVLAPTARFILEQLCFESWTNEEHLDGIATDEAYRVCVKIAQDQCRDAYLEMRQKHLAELDLERKKVEFSFRTRRSLLQKIGLPEVRDYRLRLLAEEEAEKANHLAQQGEIAPQLMPLLIFRIGQQNV
jgi:superfamily II DNA or RNA helicase